jgi:hypothetical protein
MKIIKNNVKVTCLSKIKCGAHVFTDGVLSGMVVKICEDKDFCSVYVDAIHGDANFILRVSAEECLLSEPGVFKYVENNNENTVRIKTLQIGVVHANKCKYVLGELVYIDNTEKEYEIIEVRISKGYEPSYVVNNGYGASVIYQSELDKYNYVVLNKSIINGILAKDKTPIEYKKEIEGEWLPETNGYSIDEIRNTIKPNIE